VLIALNIDNFGDYV